MEQMIQDLIRQVNDLQTKVDGLVKPEKLDNRFINSYTINGASSQFANAQAAIDFAEANGFYHVYFPDGSYDNIVLSVDGMTVEGASLFDTKFEDTSSHCIQISAHYATIRNLRVSGTPGGGNLYNLIHIDNAVDRAIIRGVYFHIGDNNGLYCDGRFATVTGCTFAGVDGTRVVLDTNSDDCNVVGNSNIDGDTTNNGTGNVIASNT